MAALKEVKMEYISREKNERADGLSKLASIRKIGCHKTIVHETLSHPSIIKEEVNLVVETTDTPDWRTPIIEVLESNEEKQAGFSAERKREAHHYALIGGILYKQGFTSELLRRVTIEQSNMRISEFHEGECSSHIGGRALTAKVLRA